MWIRISIFQSILLSCTHAGSIPPVENLPKEEVVEAPPVMKTELELSPDHDVAELPLIPPDLFPSGKVSDFGDPFEPFRPSGPDDQLKSVNGDNTPADPRPCGRWQHSAVVIGDEILVYGGVSNGGVGVLSDLWFYDAPGGGWTKLEKSEMCTLPASANPRLATSQNSGRPPFFPAPPRFIQPPGIDSERINQLRVEQEAKTEKNTKPFRVDRITPIPVEEPLMPQAEAGSEAQDNGNVGKSDTKSKMPTNIIRRRRRRLLAYARLGVLPAAEYNELQANPLTLGEVWSFSIAKRRWYQPYPTGEQPPPRWLHAAVSLGGKMFVFGGVTNNLMLLNDLWEYSPIPNSWREISLGKSMDRPVSREGHTMVALPSKNGNDPTGVIVFGGISYGYVPFNDLWYFSAATENWEKIDPVDGNSVISSAFSNTKTEKKEPAKPPGRWMHTAIVLDGALGKAMFVFGGCSEEFAPLNDLWRFDVKTKVWLQLANKGPKFHDTVNRPAGRWLHSSVVLDLANGGKGVVVFGGGVNNDPMDDLWYWDTKERVWEEMHPFTDHPYARMGHTAVHVVRDEAIGQASRRRRRRRLLEGNTVSLNSPRLGMSNSVFSSYRFKGSGALRGFVGDAVTSAASSAGVPGTTTEKSEIVSEGSGDLFAMDGPQEVKLIDPSATPDTVQRPTRGSMDFMFVWGGMSEKGLGSSASGFGLGTDSEK